MVHTGRPSLILTTLSDGSERVPGFTVDSPGTHTPRSGPTRIGDIIREVY